MILVFVRCIRKMFYSSAPNMRIYAPLFTHCRATRLIKVQLYSLQYNTHAWNVSAPSRNIKRIFLAVPLLFDERPRKQKNFPPKSWSHVHICHYYLALFRILYVCFEFAQQTSNSNNLSYQSQSKVQKKITVMLCYVYQPSTSPHFSKLSLGVRLTWQKIITD